MASIHKLPSGKWRAQIRRRGQYRADTFLTREAAARWARATEVALEKGELEPVPAQGPTVEELARRYIEEYARQHKRSWKRDHEHLERDVLPRLGEMLAGSVTRGDIREMLSGVAARGAPVAANRVLAVCKKMWNWALDHEVSGIETNPCLRIKPPAPTRSKERVLTMSEIRTLLAALDRDEMPAGCRAWPTRATRVAIQLILLTGQRPGEVAGMALTELDRQDGWWTIPGERAKNGRAHRVPICAGAKRLIDEALALRLDPKSAYVFPSPRRSGGRRDRAIAAEAISRAVTRLREHVGIPHWTAHDLRRTCASHLAGLGVSREVIARLLNHTDRSVTSIYERYGYGPEMRQALDRWEEALA
ncbi:integrase family protein [Thioalkalivibrio sulfidiphilus HL-EbGr7]|uniref:Integrase family protein n=1 Tax=Thioalkalivibrio sulfidiphilus (strain HL-EbGR7) TaxID=396588 RepID=B8GSD9_THISH|nr:site-specific integrase [Thioalkalivibrio sulfidiphilus]ACL72843.1 integrase family protein [Thioalkalivibrio sulfidiphilus HL-EbGr7]